MVKHGRSIRRTGSNPVLSAIVEGCQSPVIMKRYPLIILFLFFCPIIAYSSEPAIYKRAKIIIHPGTIVKIYKLSTKSIKIVEVKRFSNTKNPFEVRINGKRTDIRIIYVKVNKRWVNLALLIGITDVPERFPEFL